jgi:hypothetical protein
MLCLDSFSFLHDQSFAMCDFGDTRHCLYLNSWVISLCKSGILHGQYMDKNAQDFQKTGVSKQAQ